MTDETGVEFFFFAVPEGLHPNTVNLVARFASALAEKLAAAERKYGYSDGWADAGWMDECRQKLVEHIAKGDPRDVAAYCAFLWHHGESTTPPAQQPAETSNAREWRNGEAAPECPTITDDEPVKLLWRDDEGRRCTTWASANEIGRWKRAALLRDQEEGK